MDPLHVRNEPINTDPIQGCELPPQGFDPYAPPEPSDEQRALNHQMFMALQTQQEILPSEAIIRIKEQEARIGQLLDHVARLTEVVNNLLSK